MEDKEFSNMNVIPLVDVMLVLLTIVLTTSTFIAMGSISVELPRTANTDTAQVKSKTIEIDKRGILYLDAKSVSLARLREELSTLERSMPILIRADRNIVLQVFVDVMDIVKGLGFTKVNLQTEMEQ